MTENITFLVSFETRIRGQASGYTLRQTSLSISVWLIPCILEPVNEGVFQLNRVCFASADFQRPLLDSGARSSQAVDSPLSAGAPAELEMDNDDFLELIDGDEAHREYSHKTPSENTC